MVKDKMRCVFKVEVTQYNFKKYLPIAKTHFHLRLALTQVQTCQLILLCRMQWISARLENNSFPVSIFKFAS